MKKYNNPVLNEETIQIEDVIAVSLGGDVNIGDGGIPSIGPGDFKEPTV